MSKYTHLFNLSHSTSNSRVTHREIGDIPGLVLAHDVFVSIPLEEMQKYTGARADEFIRLLTTCDTVEFKNHPFHNTDVPVSVIKNPAKRAPNPWDADFQEL